MAKRKSPPLSANLPAVGTPTDDEWNYIKFLDTHGQRVELIDPLSDEGLRFQALYVQNLSQHPLDYLQRVMSNPFADPKDRIAAAKTLLEYGVRKPGQSLDIKASSSVLNIPTSQLSGLTAKELDSLETLLSKASSNAS